MNSIAVEKKQKQSVNYAKQLDAEDKLADLRSFFHLPQIKGKRTVYFTGNSLGCMPKLADKHLQTELNIWRKYAVEGHFTGKNPWESYHTTVTKSLANLVGAVHQEVVAMNSLTVNLHLLLTSFYRPTAQKYKIICEAGAFSSDQYALQSQVKLHGFDPETAIVEIKPRPNEHTLHTQDILDAIALHANETALVFFSGVNYYTGQFFDLKSICEVAIKHKIYVGFDLAHAIGNVPLQLHEWGADFAVWCSYKYLNSGPGGVGGAFVHNRHATNAELPRLAGWWGHNAANRFKMPQTFEPMDGAEGWQLSNAPILSLAVHKAALEVIDRATFEAMTQKSKRLMQHLLLVLNILHKIFGKNAPFKIITPLNPDEHGCQLSISFAEGGKEICDRLHKANIIVDWREPNVMRLAPVPLYNTFSDIARFYHVMKSIFIDIYGYDDDIED